ncbi:MerR family transcriptional regulator [Streptomyces litchfieldiae]|uniref:MerR family transcriptional regulator n=1 Tax=Streptomyces litchfieldiae TaxID=3075543 RepID=A0ABU2MTQ2_9ACTN|nr:MerR family transcriptional regulator [Streptomyces sp. DSM 44938]MDT0344787.1 MerR family transcriptional regulator [Streptomyces sp. DSM 44938]
MRIGELASRTGVSVRSLRYYEEQGLLKSSRSAGGQRHYTDSEVERVTFIQRLYAAGLSSRTIAELLPCVESPSEENSETSLERMVQERDRLSQHIADLMRTRRALDGVIAAARTHRENQRATAVVGSRQGSGACTAP